MTDRIHMRNQRAFSLIEVMVALTLLALVAALLASGTRLSLDVSARGNSRADAIRTEHLERGLLRSQLQGALPYRYWIADENKRVEFIAFDGESDRIRFISRDGVLDGPNGLPRWVDWSSQDVGNGVRRLVVEERRILSTADNGRSENATARVEMASCSDIHFEYLDTTGERPEWLSTWAGPDRRAPLPFAVRIKCVDAKRTIQLLVPFDFADSARQGMAIQ